MYVNTRFFYKNSGFLLRLKYSYDVTKYKGEIFLMYIFLFFRVEFSVHEKQLLTISYLAGTLINEMHIM